MPNYWLKRTADAAVEGPLTREQLTERVRLKHLTSAALISPDRSHWHPITAIKGLFETDEAPPARPKTDIPLISDITPVSAPPIPGINELPPGRDTPGISPPDEPIPIAVPLTPVTPRRAIPLVPAPLFACRIEEPGESNAALVWPSALLAPPLLAVCAHAAWTDASRPHPDMIAMVYAFWTALGVLTSLVVLYGVARRNALPYRAGVVIAPLGAGFLLLSGLRTLESLDAPAGLAPLGVIVLGILTPILWTRSGAKRFFGLSCPECNSVNVAAESFGFRERRCKNCGTLFTGRGEIAATAPPRRAR